MSTVALFRDREQFLALRVLTAIGPDWIRHQDVLRSARMDTSTCGYLLRRLRALGWINAGLLRRAAGGGSGAPACIYHRTAVGMRVLADLTPAQRQEVARSSARTNPCACGRGPMRPGQRNCKQCHADNMRKWRTADEATRIRADFHAPQVESR